MARRKLPGTLALASEHDPEAGYVAYGGRFVFPRRFEALYRDRNVVMQVYLSVDDRGRVGVEQLNIRRPPGGGAVTGATLRAIPVDTLAREAMKMAAYEIVSQTPGEPPELRRAADPDLTGIADPDFSGDELFAVYQQATHKPFRRGKPVTDAHLREVVQVYRDATATKQRPKQTIARVFHVSTSTASRWIRAARDRGFLGDAIPGVAGELEQEESNG